MRCAKAEDVNLAIRICSRSSDPRVFFSVLSLSWFTVSSFIVIDVHITAVTVRSRHIVRIIEQGYEGIVIGKRHDAFTNYFLSQVDALSGSVI